MAASNDIQIERTGKTAKVRNPWLVLLFTIITIGIYGICWWYFINREMSDLGRGRGTDRLGKEPGLSVVAYTVGSVVYIPWIWTVVTTNRRAQRAQALTAGKTLNGWIAAALWILTLSMGGVVYLQYELNKVWRAQGMRPVEPPDDAAAALESGDAARREALAELESSGGISSEEREAQEARLSLQ